MRHGDERRPVLDLEKPVVIVNAVQAIRVELAMVDPDVFRVADDDGVIRRTGPLGDDVRDRDVFDDDVSPSGDFELDADEVSGVADADERLVRSDVNRIGARELTRKRYDVGV